MIEKVNISNTSLSFLATKTKFISFIKIIKVPMSRPHVGQKTNSKFPRSLRALWLINYNTTANTDDNNPVIIIATYLTDVNITDIVRIYVSSTIYTNQ